MPNETAPVIEELAVRALLDDIAEKGADNLAQELIDFLNSRQPTPNGVVMAALVMVLTSVMSHAGEEHGLLLARTMGALLPEITRMQGTRRFTQPWADPEYEARH